MTLKSRVRKLKSKLSISSRRTEIEMKNRKKIRKGLKGLGRELKRRARR